MSSAFAWLGQIIEWFGQFIPRWVLLDSTQEAVKFTHEFYVDRWKIHGRLRVTRLEKGGHVYWPLMSRINTVPVVRDTMDLEGQVITLKGGKPVLVSGMVRFAIFDIERAVANTSDIFNCVRDEAMCAIHDTLENYTWEEAHAAGKELAVAMTKTAQKELTRYGVRVQKIGIKDLAQTKVYKIVQEQS